jgi:hypothetical protein
LVKVFLPQSLQDKKHVLPVAPSLPNYPFTPVFERLHRETVYRFPQPGNQLKTNLWPRSAACPTVSTARLYQVFLIYPFTPGS